MRGDALKRAVDAAVSERQAEAASRTAKLRDAHTRAARADARLQTVRSPNTTQALLCTSAHNIGRGSASSEQ